ncbi:hypothetical protein [Desulfovibrio sp. Huiquan2017]|uniref:hypothetical protein n=1 Tax=Desulfovibrio sp. Huiquan2017 TaxID=2816861 RepID=UPI001A90FB49|nr:hypothetical protein [Desulfovibrio sp. Huiquan2017]
MFNNGKSINEILIELNYNPKEISQWIQNILQEREDFKLKYVLTPRKERGTGRAPETLIHEDARILINNLCVLKPYTKLFPQNPSDSELKMYQDLRDGSFKRYIDRNVVKLKNKLVAYKEFNNNALANLEPFYAALKEVDAIDIEKESLEEMMGKYHSGTEIYERNPHELACWGDILELQAELDETPNDPVLHRKLAEIWYSLGQLDEGLDHITECLERSPEDGVAWAIRAKILLDQLEEKQNERALYSYDCEDSPYSASIRRSAIDRIYPEGFFKIEVDEELRMNFVESAFKSLQFWPYYECGIEDYCEQVCEGCERYQQEHLHDMKDAPNCDFSMTRDFLFFHLVSNMRKSDFTTERSVIFLDLHNEFKSRNEVNSFPLVRFKQDSPEYKRRIPFLVMLTQLLKETSLEEYELLLDSFIQDFKEDKRHAGHNLEMLAESCLSHDFWQFLGPKEYSELHKLLWHFLKQQELDDQFISLSSNAWQSVLTPLRKPIKIYSQYKNKFLLKYWPANLRPKFPDHTAEQVGTAFAEGVVEAYSKKEALESVLNSALLFSTAQVADLPVSYRQVIPLLALLEYNLSGSQKAKETLDTLTATPSILRNCFYSEDITMIDLFDEFWAHPRTHPKAGKPSAFFEAIRIGIEEKNS